MSCIVIGKVTAARPVVTSIRRTRSGDTLRIHPSFTVGEIAKPRVLRMRLPLVVSIESTAAMSGVISRWFICSIDTGESMKSTGTCGLVGASGQMCVAMTTEPGVVSPMGGGFVTIWPAGEEPETIDGNVAMPGRGLPEDRFGQGLRQFDLAYGGGITIFGGWGSAGIPGALSALQLAHDRHGSGAWAQAIEPAETAAREGFRLGSAAASYLALTTDNLFGWDRETTATLTRADGTHLQAGDKIRDTALADSWARIGEHGAGDLYTGEIGRRLADACAANGGLITAEDLAAYEPIVRQPLRMSLGDWDIATNPPPSIGGPMLAVMLSELVRRGRIEWADIIEVQQAVLTYRSTVHDYSPDLEEDGYLMLETGVAPEASRDLFEAVQRKDNGALATATQMFQRTMGVPS